jgi:hypothetical protein
VGKRILWFLCKFTHPQNAIVQEGTNVAQRMDGTSKVSAMMNKRVCTATTAECSNQISSQNTKMRCRTAFSWGLVVKRPIACDE